MRGGRWEPDDCWRWGQRGSGRDSGFRRQVGRLCLASNQAKNQQTEQHGQAQKWIPSRDGRLTLNPEIAFRYFYNTERVPSANHNYFDEVKQDNSYRVFVMGGSSAAGFPYSPNGAFSRYIRKRLELLYPAKKIEVVNIAMSAINSYALRDILPGVLEKQPDLIVIYAGHNEYYGALGVGSVETLGDTRFIVNSVIWLNQFKTFELLRNVIKSVSSMFSDPVMSDGTLMARMSQRQQIPFESEIYFAGLS